MKILIITSCTGAKKYKPDNQLTQDDFKKLGTEAFKRREKTLEDFKLPAKEMYKGQQHVHLLKGLELIRIACPKITIDLKIVSAGYGLLDENSPILPYEQTFNNMKAKEIRSWAYFLKIPLKIVSTISNYDLNIFLLGKEYIKAINFPKTLSISGNCIFLTGKGSAPYLPTGPNIHMIYLGNEDAKRLSAGLVALKGRVIEIVGEFTKAQGPSFMEDLIKHPYQLDIFLKSYKKSAHSKQKDSGAALKADYDTRVIKLSKDWIDNLHRKKMLYFIPEWDDHVNPSYDFLTDTHPPGTGDTYDVGCYSHQIYDKPAYDGILISKVNIEAKKSKKAILEKLGVHRYLRVPREFPIMGDCGAFGYIEEKEPPYETEEILNYYQNLDFDYGVSIDHLIVNAVLKKNVYYLVNDSVAKKQISKEEYNQLRINGEAKEIKSLKRQLHLFEEGPYLYKQEIIDENERQRRYELTIKNAKSFIEGHRKNKFTFTPIGAAQGWSPQSYADAVFEYQKMGYNYIALGGLVRTNTTGVLDVLEAVNKVLKKNVLLHLFGVARPDALLRMYELGIRSIDSASFIRRAWLGATSNYFTPDINYAAIRIPQAEKSPRAKKIVREGRASLDEIKRLEKKCLELVRSYDRDAVDIDTVLETVMTYDDLLGGNRNGHRELIRKTLENKPWRNCSCKICKKIGVEVIIFRGNNRNRRRGFHNTKVFYDQFCRMFGDS